MCGIAGIWHLNGKALDQPKLQRFTDSICHRGPDGGHYWVSEDRSIGLGHRRLSILDLSESGDQPMSYADERYWIIYNGEVFNFLELRRELEGKGYTFRSTSDTEIILAAYDCWGTDCLPHFNGMWGMAIYDKKHETLFLARDRFGIKPLYYMHKPGELFVFASETLSFKYLEGHTREFNQQHLSLNIEDPFALEGFGHTIYKNVFQVLPGHYMLIRKQTRTPEQKRWWSTLNAKVNVPSDYEQQVEQYKELFFDAVKLRLRSDVPLASALSGGLDSSSVYCTIYKIMNSSVVKERTPDNWQKAFVASFPGSAIDETAFAQEVVDFTNGNVEFVKPDFSNLAEDIKRTTILFDAIYNSPISVSNEIYGTMYRQGVKVSMDGHGVDEMLFGYSNMIGEVLAQSRMNGTYAKTLRDTIHQMNTKEAGQAALVEIDSNTDSNQSAFMSSAKKFARQLIPLGVQRMLSRNGVVGDHFSLYHNRKLSQLSKDLYETSAMEPAEKIPFESFHLRVLPTILRNFDRTSMQNSIEIRMPFMDYRLVSYVFSLPFSSKVGGGFSKRILRDAMKGIIPEKVRTRKWKVGFSAPMPEWFNNQLQSFILDEVNSQAFLQSHIWNGRRIRDFVAKKMKERSWNWEETIAFWPIFNAHLLITNNRDNP